MGCCNTCYADCRPLDSCFTDLIVYTPVGQEGDINISLENGQGFRQQYWNYEITNGFITPDLSIVPDGFFSAYGGPYKLKFYNSTTGQLIEFTAIDGKRYDCIQFEIVNSTNGPETAFINVFSNDVPTPY
jgi:hypothetical protein